MLRAFSEKNVASINYYRKEINEIKKNQNESLVIAKSIRTNKYEHISLKKLINIYNQQFCIGEEIDSEEQTKSTLFSFDLIDNLLFVYKPCLSLEQTHRINSHFQKTNETNEEITNRNQLIENILGKFKYPQHFKLRIKNQKQISKSLDISKDKKSKNVDFKSIKTRKKLTKRMITPSDKSQFDLKTNDSFLRSNKYEKLLQINDFLSENKTINKKINEFYQEEDDLNYIKELNFCSKQTKIKKDSSQNYKKMAPPVSRLKRKFLKFHQNNNKVSSFPNNEEQNVLLNRLTASAIVNHNWTSQISKNRILNLSPEFEDKHEQNLTRGRYNFSSRRKEVELKNKLFLNSSIDDDRFFSLIKNYEEENEVFFGMKNKDYKEVLEFYDLNNLLPSNSKLNNALQTVTYIKQEKKSKEKRNAKNLLHKQMKFEENENGEIFQARPTEGRNVGIKLREKHLRKYELNNLNNQKL